MRRFLLASMFLTCSTFTTQAQDEKCTLANDYCVPIVGCIVETGEIMTGRSYGRRSGPFYVWNRKGTQCLGAWRVNILGGVGDLVCDDGRKADVRYKMIDQRTGTATGTGKLNTGNHFVFWSGHNIPGLLANKPELLSDAVSCLKDVLG